MNGCFFLHGKIWVYVGKYTSPMDAMALQGTFEDDVFMFLGTQGYDGLLRVSPIYPFSHTTLSDRKTL